jgi:hypothetical protein
VPTGLAQLTELALLLAEDVADGSIAS